MITPTLAAALAFTFGDQEFIPLEEYYSSSHTQTAHAWIASNLYAHEILLLDPMASPLLRGYYEQGKDLFLHAASQGIPPLLSSISNFLHTTIFTNQQDRRQATQEVIHSWGHPCIPLEVFIKHRTGVCRHFVLTAAYILTRLQNEATAPLALQEVHIIRRNLYRNNLEDREFDKEDPQNFHSERMTIAKRQDTSEDGSSEANTTQSKIDSSGCFGITKAEVQGRHAWLEVGNWHFDPYWNLIADLADPRQKEFLYQIYGAVVINP